MMIRRRGKGEKAQAGFGLIEIMVALGLGAIILLGVAEIFTNNSRTRAETERTSRQIESGAYALRVLESEIASAGFWGEADEQPVDISTLPPLCPTTDTQIIAAMGYPVQGQNGPGVSCITPKAGTDFIAIRRANSCALDPVTCPAPNPDFAFYMQMNACFVPDDLTVDLPGTMYIEATPADLDTGTELDCATPAPVYGLHSRIYFVNADDQLVRMALTADTTNPYQETILVDGVETMRLEYGIDTTGDGQVDIQALPTTPAEWSNVAMVRASLVIRNLESTGGYLDDRTYDIAGSTYSVPAAFQDHKRQVYSRTISMRNIAGRRELP
ncbi:MAG: PilW family protein [Haliea sp.]